VDRRRRRGALNPFTGYTAQTGHTVTYSDDNNRRYYQTGLYLQDEMVWDRWHVDVSARYDRIVSQQVSDTLGTSNRRSDDHISGARRCCTPWTTVFRPT
jgi:iron complex outermembrane receptor protein